MSALKEIAKIRIEERQCKSCPDGRLHKQIAYLLKAFEVMKHVATRWYESADACDNGGNGREGDKALAEVVREFEQGMR